MFPVRPATESSRLFALTFAIPLVGWMAHGSIGFFLRSQVRGPGRRARLRAGGVLGSALLWVFASITRRSEPVRTPRPVLFGSIGAAGWQDAAISTREASPALLLR